MKFFIKLLGIVVVVSGLMGCTTMLPKVVSGDRLDNSKGYVESSLTII